MCTCFIVGALVLAEDPETGEQEYKEVVQVFENETNELVHLTVNGEEIVTTPKHPFYVPQRGWISAIDLNAGDILVLSNGEYVTVEQVQHEILEAPVKIYNFEVQDFHTYYVGSSSVLVHNLGCGSTTESDISKEIAVYDPEFATRQLLNGGTTSEDMLRTIIPKDIPNTFVPSDTIETGYKYNFTVNGKKVEIKWHSADLNAATKYPGSNSGAGFTAQIKVGKKLLGQDGIFYRKPRNSTHIPLMEGS